MRDRGAYNAYQRDAAIEKSLREKQQVSKLKSKKQPSTFRTFPCTQRLLSYPVIQGGPGTAVTAATVLGHVERLRHCWVRSPKEWEEKFHSPRRNLADLLRHLFAKYRTPLFLDSVLYQREYAPIMGIYPHVAQGGNIRKYLNEQYVDLTKKMAHTLLNSDSKLDFLPALRRAQIMAMGGTPRLWTHMCRTRYANTLHVLNRERFWATVYQWFCNHPMIDPNQIGPMLDYINHRLTENPQFTMRGRTPMRLYRDMLAWHGNIHQMRRYSNVPATFNSCGLRTWNYIEKKKDRRSGQTHKQHWRISEILSRKELMDEGTEMKHCVGSYGGSIAGGRCSVWTMTSIFGGMVEKRLTIELEGRSVRQARGKCNKPAGKEEAKILERWAQDEGLTLNYFGRWM
jgi:hypothetical protein